MENLYNKKFVRLTSKEITKLRKINLGYGKFITNARSVKLHPNTYRYILDRGHGTQRSIDKIRAVLLQENENNPYQPAIDQAG